MPAFAQRPMRIAALLFACFLPALAWAAEVSDPAARQSQPF